MKTFIIVCISLITVFSSATSYSQVAFNNIALTGATIIDANHQKSLEHQTVLIKGNIIEQIFADGSKPLPDSAVIINIKGKFLIPGLIDTHVHMATDPTDVDNRASTLAVLSRMLHTGVTSVRDMAGDARTLASLSRDAMTGDIISPNIYYSALMAGPQFFEDPRVVSSTRGLGTGKAPYMQAISDTTNLVLAVAKAKGTGATGIKLYANLSAALATKIIEEAKIQGIKVWGHGWLQGARPIDLVKAGISSISHVPHLIYENFDSIPVSWRSKHDDKFWNDSAHIHSDFYKLMRSNNTILDATLLTYKIAAKDENSKWYYQYQIGKRLIVDAYKAGVKICAGTDDDQEQFVQYEMEILVKEAGFSNIDALIAATKTGAEAIGIENSCGTIEINKIADMVVLDKNPLEKIENINSVFLVIKEGKIYNK
jgi:imidazolonepropionase-like amidohydrolase